MTTLVIPFVFASSLWKHKGIFMTMPLHTGKRLVDGKTRDLPDASGCNFSSAKIDSIIEYADLQPRRQKLRMIFEHNKKGTAQRGSKPKKTRLTNITG
jgi:hypothetical protein